MLVVVQKYTTSRRWRHRALAVRIGDVFGRRDVLTSIGCLDHCFMMSQYGAMTPTFPFSGPLQFVTISNQNPIWNYAYGYVSRLNYAALESMSGVIAPLGATSVTLRFISFATEKGSDFVTVKSCLNISYCDTVLLHHSGPTLPGLVTSATGIMRIEWDSDDMVTATGWEATWSAVYPNLIPPARFGFGFVASGNNCYLFGGGLKPYSGLYGVQLYLQDFYLFDTRDSLWRDLSNIPGAPSARYVMGIVSCQSKLYVFGGFDKQAGYLNDMYKFDTRTLFWSKLKTLGPIPPPRVDPVLAATGQYIYLFSGCQYWVGESPHSSL